MRHLLLLTASSLALCALGACATSDDQPAAPTNPDGGSLPNGNHEAGVDAAAEAAPDAAASTCSPDGWCTTPLPDTDLAFKDIWPFPGRAFAVATSPTLGTRVLEWSDAAGQWNYIDDATQNAGELGKYVGRMWAANENEIYYGISPGTIYRGTRGGISATWSWTRARLDDQSVNPGAPNAGYISSYAGGGYQVSDYSLGVWGTGPNDVYAWYMNAIFHWKSEGGAPASWVLEYAARDVPETYQSLYILSAAGTTGDDLWFAGTRPGSSRACALAVHKVGSEYKRVVDGILSPSPDAWDAQCVASPGAQVVAGTEGWVASIQAPAPGLAVMLAGARTVARVTKDGDGYTVDISRIPESVIVPVDRMLSLWSASGTEQWISGKGIVLRANDPWSGGAYEISTLALRGAPIRSDLLRIRGTSNTNLWAIGAGYALHKTSP